MSVFVVSVHDVAPSTFEPIAEWVAALDERNVPCTLLVIPGPYGEGPGLAKDPDLVSYLHTAAANGHELSLHGFRHAGIPGGVPWRQAANRVLARGAAEFCSLTRTQAHALLRQGLEELEGVGMRVTGFTPPGWLASPGTRQALADLDFAYWTSHLAVHDLRTGRARRMPALSHRPGGTGERTGARLMVAGARAFTRTGAPFRIALHPADLARPGLRAAALTAIDHALASGGRPMTYQALVGEAR
ncbi:MAG TPA: polysaccharide deacetylase family protein [Thermomonospora sp.]|nr:polysaccharide deacetylase family protein [Thermomonospora sp.]